MLDSFYKAQARHTTHHRLLFMTVDDPSRCRQLHDAYEQRLMYGTEPWVQAWAEKAQPKTLQTMASKMAREGATDGTAKSWSRSLVLELKRCC